jgi:hypothetical protein
LRLGVAVIGPREIHVLVLDPLALMGLAALLTSISALIWAVRRKP